MLLLRVFEDNPYVLNNNNNNNNNNEAQINFSPLAARLAIRSNCCKSQDFYSLWQVKPGISQSECQSLVVPFVGNWLLVASPSPS